jgi:hypothetical protein
MVRLSVVKTADAMLVKRTDGGRQTERAANVGAEINAPRVRFLVVEANRDGILAPCCAVQHTFVDICKPQDAAVDYRSVEGDPFFRPAKGVTKLAKTGFPCAQHARGGGVFDQFRADLMALQAAIDGEPPASWRMAPNRLKANINA